MKFDHRTALITGAANGIGRATAVRLAQEGVNLAAVDMDGAGLDSLKKSLKDTKIDVQTYVCDVSDEARVREVAAQAITHLGKIDILINDAGIFRRWIPFRETTSDMWKKYFMVNVFSAMCFSHALVDHMCANGYGRIINLGSVAGVYGNASMVDYSMTKGAIISFTKALAKELSPHGVLVNCVSPGSVAMADDPHEINDFSFIGRSGQPEEFANVICFLASDEASYVSGQNYQVDGCRRKM